MAKDAKGHGSEARSGHEHAIAKDTVKNPLKGVFLGGPTAAQAEAKLRGRFGYSDKEISSLKGDSSSGGQPVVSDAHAAATLAGGPKSAPVETHPAMKDWAGRTDADLKKDYGGPVRHYDGKAGGERPSNFYDSKGKSFYKKGSVL